MHIIDIMHDIMHMIDIMHDMHIIDIMHDMHIIDIMHDIMHAVRSRGCGCASSQQHSVCGCRRHSKAWPLREVLQDEERNAHTAFTRIPLRP
jgi:hypothetical protein